MALLNEFRPLRLIADGKEIGADQRLSIKGSGNMTLLPDYFQADVYNMSDEDFATLQDAKNLSALGVDDSLLFKGEISDVYTRLEGVNTVTSIAVVDGKSFWSAKVNKTLGAGSSIRDAIINILQGASFGQYLAQNTRLPRGQTFTGRVAENVSMLALSANARAFVTGGVVYVVEHGRASDVVDIEDGEIITESSTADGVRMMKTIVKGYPIGIIVRRKGRNYRLVSHKYDADNFKGNWDSEIMLVDEDHLTTDGMVGG